MKIDIKSLTNPLEFTNSNCAYVDSEIFFTPTTEKEASTVCQGCVYIEKCLQWGLTYEAFGVWGGKTAEERRKIRNKYNLDYVKLEND